jgi:hypothetical protein
MTGIKRTSAAALVVVTTVLWAGTSRAQDVTPAGEVAAMRPIWRCHDPLDPPRTVADEERKADPPVCNKWVQVRGRGVLALLASHQDSSFGASNLFLSAAGGATNSPYPYVGGSPVTTSDLYRNPGRYGFKVIDTAGAEPGSLVLYNGLGGILVETRASPDEPWEKKVLYPSTRHGGKLWIASLDIPGKLEAKVLVKEPR